MQSWSDTKSNLTLFSAYTSTVLSAVCNLLVLVGRSYVNLSLPKLLERLVTAPDNKQHQNNHCAAGIANAQQFVSRRSEMQFMCRVCLGSYVKLTST